MNWPNVLALVDKDIKLYFRNRFFAVVTVLGLVFYLIIYFLLPNTVDESLKIGLYAPALPPIPGDTEEEGLVINVVDSEDSLKQGVFEGDFVAGIALPPDFLEQLTSEQKPHILAYFTADAPQEIRDSISVIIRELAYQMSGQTLTIDITEEILGPDMLGQQIPMRNRMRSMIILLLVMVEMLGLSTLISEEVEHRTIHALLITPMTVKELFMGKSITGIGLAFTQAVLFMAIVGGLNRQPIIILTALLLGSGMITGISFIIASLSKDMLSVMGWGISVLLILFVPAFGVMFPGLVTDWVRIVPSYYLIDTVHQVNNFGAGWGDTWLNLAILLGFDVVMAWLGIVVLRRKF
jgi:ABC-2 type transport system permease protein